MPAVLCLLSHVCCPMPDCLRFYAVRWTKASKHRTWHNKHRTSCSSHGTVQISLPGARLHMDGKGLPSARPVSASGGPRHCIAHNSPCPVRACENEGPWNRRRRLENRALGRLLNYWRSRAPGRGSEGSAGGFGDCPVSAVLCLTVLCLTVLCLLSHVCCPMPDCPMPDCPMPAVPCLLSHACCPMPDCLRSCAVRWTQASKHRT